MSIVCVYTFFCSFLYGALCPRSCYGSCPIEMSIIIIIIIIIYFVKLLLCFVIFVYLCLFVFFVVFVCVFFPLLFFFSVQLCCCLMLDSWVTKLFEKVLALRWKKTWIDRFFFLFFLLFLSPSLELKADVAGKFLKVVKTWRHALDSADRNWECFNQKCHPTSPVSIAREVGKRDYGLSWRRANILAGVSGFYPILPFPFPPRPYSSLHYSQGLCRQ